MRKENFILLEKMSKIMALPDAARAAAAAGASPAGIAPKDMNIDQRRRRMMNIMVENEGTPLHFACSPLS